jgi:outer membrane receptor protein involved in Fe transport
MRNLRSICILFVLALLAASMAYSQAVNATLLGNVTDASGGVVPNAKVTITEVNTGVGRTSQTNESGNYTFPDLAPGNYTVEVEVSGFKKERRANVVVEVNSSTRVDLQLQTGNVSESVEVVATTPLLQTDRADTGVKFDAVQTANFPVGTNRNFQSILNAVPGTTPATFQHSQFFNAASSLQTEVNGQMRQGNNYTIEGVDDNERTGLLQILVPPIEAIQTVDVATSNFSAELGRASGAVVNVMLKSGSNQIHGAAYEFFKNSALNARSFFDPSVGHLAYNYYGGNVGGPIKKNKLFYFGDILRVTDHEANTNLHTIPTPTQISGNLSASTTPIYDPGTGNPDGTGRSPFNLNMIPSSKINLISAKLLALLPAPNVVSASGTNNFFALLPFTKDSTSFDTKIDYVVSEKSRLSGRFSFTRPVVFQAPTFGVTAGGPSQGNFEGTGIQRTYSTGLSYDRVISPTLITEFRIGVAHYHNEAQNSDYGKNTSADLGIPGVNIGPFFSGIVGINFSSFYSDNLIGYSASVPWVRAEANIDVVNTWTKILGNHTFKFGGDLKRVRDDLLQDQTFSPRGVYNFRAGQTSLKVLSGNAPSTSYYNNFAAFLLDVPNQAGRDLGQYFPAYRQWEFFAFAQDKWQVSPKLTLDLGLRWEFYKPATPQFKGGFSNYNAANNTLVIAGVGGNPSDLGMVTRYKNFAPRIGFAYRLTEKTVIRAGFGISYTPFPDNTYAYNYPIRANNQFDPAVSTYCPAVLPDGRVATFQTGFPAPINPPIPANGILNVSSLGSLANSTYVQINTDFKNPYVESWNFAIQQALPMKFTLDVAYVGNHGVDSVVAYNLNAATTAGGGNASLPQFASFGRTGASNLYFQGFSNHYNALQVKLDRRFAGGLTMTTAYTWGKGMGYQTGDDGGLYFYVNPRRGYARNDFDRTQTFVQTYVYDLPFGPGKKWMNSGLVGNVFGGWRVSGLLQFWTGTPFNVTGGSALNTPGSNQTADQVAPVQILHGINIGNPWFSPTSYVPVTAAGVFGNSGRNAITGPGFGDLTAALSKIIRYKERWNLEIRGEAFNATNHPHFGNPGANASNYNPDPSKNTFGVVTGLLGGTSGRVLQLGLKLNF